MVEEQIVLTQKGFKKIKDLIPNKDYLITSNGKKSKFFGFKPTLCQYDVLFSTGERLVLSGDASFTNEYYTINDICDVEMMYTNGINQKMIKKINVCDYGCKTRSSLSFDELYEIGYKHQFVDIIQLDIIKMTLKQRKTLLAGIIDNGEVSFNNATCIKIKTNSLLYSVPLLILIRSLGYGVGLTKDSVTFTPNSNCGILPIKSYTKSKDFLLLANMTKAKYNNILIKDIDETIIKNGYILEHDNDLPILAGYSLVPIYQKG